MNLQALAVALKDKARSLGFDLVGITTPDPPEHFEVYRRWVAAGYHGDMHYLATERALARRADPRRILPECESIVVLGMRYPAPPEDIPPHPQDHPRGRVAAYAWGADYHDVLPPRLRALVQFLEAQVGHAIPHRVYTDTGPVLERDLAQRAGLGWIGKHGNLIAPRRGSYYLLAEILLGLPLPPDPPFPTDHCGSCTRCIDACPTQCILPDRTIDARRCLSYLTIENKGPIPLALRPHLGHWVFGCDVCQMVCPWNRRFATPEGDPALAPRPEVPFPDLLADMALTPEAFRRKFKGSPIKRAKRRGYLRNVAVALGNRGDPRAVPVLAAALEDAEPLVRRHAAWALGQLGGDAACAALQAALARETDPDVLAELHRAWQHCVSGGDRPGPRTR